jgi:hypothetical protein
VKRLGLLLSAIVASVALAGCGTISASQALHNWATQADFLKNTTTLLGDAHQVAGQLSDAKASPAALRTVCDVLNMDAQAANSALPTPDAQSTSLLANAYNLLGDASSVCYKSGGLPAQRVRALGYLARGVGVLLEGRARVQAAGLVP